MPTDQEKRSVVGGLVRSANREKPAVPQPDSPLRGLVHSETAARKAAANLNAAERKNLADKGVAMPDGSFPIRDATDLHDAMVRAHQASDPAAARSHIRKRANALGLSKRVPQGY